MLTFEESASLIDEKQNENSQAGGDDKLKLRWGYIDEKAMIKSTKTLI